jgi:hypothetical protein
MKIKNLFQIGLLSAFLLVGSCSDDYDGRFDKLEQQIQDLLAQTQGGAALAASITALQTQLATLSAAVGTNNTGLTASLTALNGRLTTLQTELNVIATNQTSASAAAILSKAAFEAFVAGINADVVDLQLDLTALLASNNVYDNDLTIASAADLEFAKTLGDKVKIINGDVTITFADADVNTVTAKILNITGSLTVTTKNTWTGLVGIGDELSVNHAGDINEFTILKAVGRVGVAGTETFIFGAINDGTTPTKNISFPALTTITGLINTTSIITSAKLETVSFPLLSAVPALTLSGVLLNSVNFAGATSVTGVVDVSGDKITTVNFGSLAGMLSHVTIAGDLITTVDLSSLASQGKTGSSPVDANLKIYSDKLTALNLGSLVNVYGNLVIDNNSTSYPTTQDIDVTLTALVRVNIIAIYEAKTVSLPAFTTLNGTPSGDELSFARATSLSAPLAKVTLTTAAAASELDAPNVTSLTIGTDALVVSADIEAEFPDVETLWLNGTGAYTDVTIIAATGLGNDDITSIKVSGKLGDVSLTGTGGSIVTKIETAGAFTSLEVDDFDELETLTLEHGHNPLAINGHDLTIVNNVLLTTFTTTQLDFVQNITITGNEELASFDLSSVKSLQLTSVIYLINITGNFDGITFATATGMNGTFTDSTVASGSVARVAADLTQASLATLKPFMLAIANGALATTATADPDSTIYLEYNTENPASTASLTAVWDSMGVNNGGIGPGRTTTNELEAIDLADLNSL